ARSSSPSTARPQRGRTGSAASSRRRRTSRARVTVRYPRGAQAEKQLHADALAALKRARTPEAALAVVVRLLVAQHLVETAGLPNADRQGVYEPRELAE